VILKMNLRGEVHSLVFGVFVVLIVFGDSHLTGYVGNLDTIFGVAYWKLVDVFYPVGAIAVFLLYGKTKGGLRINVLTIAMLLSFLVALALIDLDDILLVLNLNITPVKSYWVAVELFFPIYSVIAFFVFGKANQIKKTAG
jgi:hypothetical protein